MDSALYHEVDVQQGSADWLLWRLGRITPSKFNIVMCGTSKAKNTYLRELREQKLGPQMDVASLNWGKHHEKIALATYMLHTGYECRSAGFMLSKVCPLVGGSPDAIIEENFAIGSAREIIRGVEIKCPYDSRNHLRTLRDGMPQIYEWQVKGYAWLLGLTEYDYVSFDPRQRLRDQLFVQTITLSEYERRHIGEVVKEFARMLECAHGFFESSEQALQDFIALGKVPKLF